VVRRSAEGGGTHIRLSLWSSHPSSALRRTHKRKKHKSQNQNDNAKLKILKYILRFDFCIFISKNPKYFFVSYPHSFMQNTVFKCIDAIMKK
jgi:hypothetical protein